MELVKVWEEDILLPTYATGEPDKNPMFFEKRVYQGSSGVVYPHPVIESIADEKKDQPYHALFLENEYLKIMLLPELGGRVHMAYDKIGQRHFIYYNQVVKPALVGLCGPWISGGIEFNWPQHHRPSTYQPVDFSIEEHEDGSKTVWVNEVERMFRTKGMAGFTLYPGKAYLEIKAKLYNRTPIPQTFLWWANPAVKVNDDYQSVFPPDVNAVFDHGKRDVSDFPIATGTYYKVDYAPGTDISRYKNIPVPTSYMAINSAFDFMGGYEHDTQAGVLHVANHHVSPGKKQWTWGHSDFGQAWDRNLTDEDGPYIELMTGMFTDNQPDFTWLMPYEEKSFTQYFLPYRQLGLVKNATKDLLVNLSLGDGQIGIKLFATSIQSDLKVQLFNNGAHLLDKTVNVSPEAVYHTTIPVAETVTEKDFLLIVKQADGKEVLRYEPGNLQTPELPQAAKPAVSPKDVANNEQLFLTGQHLEQYRHATYNPVDYYEEALRRDVGDIRSNNALGLLYYRRGQFEISEPYFRKAIETLTQRNPNPYDSEPYYNLGLCLKTLSKPDEAYTAFYKATWSSAWQAESFFSLAQLDLIRGDHETALTHIEHAIDRNARNGKAYAIKSFCLRKLGRTQKALLLGETALERDLFNLAIYFEQYRIYTQENKAYEAAAGLEQLKKLARGNVHNYIEYALDYAAFGAYSEAIALLQLHETSNEPAYPMAAYYLAWLHSKLGHDEAVDQYLKIAASLDSKYCFPNRLEDIAVLQLAIAQNPSDYKAPYYMGNLWYDKRQYNEAIAQWELSRARNPDFATVWRNLGMAYFNKRNDAALALSCYEYAFDIDPSDARVLMELDQLRKRLNTPPAERRSVLEQYLETTIKRDDLYLERIALYNFLGRYEKALDLLMARQFHPWEGGEGKVSGQYVFSLTELAKQNLVNGNAEEAIKLLKQAKVFPHNLGEGKLYGAQENDIFYWLAVAHEKTGNQQLANEWYEKATIGLSQPSAAIFYNDQQPDKIFYQGLAWQKLGNESRANAIFNSLVTYGEAHQNDEVAIDYFAVSLPDLLIFEDDLNRRNSIHCHYMKALGLFGLGKNEEAEQALKNIASDDAMHFGASVLHNLKQQQQKPDLV